MGGDAPNKKGGVGESNKNPKINKWGVGVGGIIWNWKVSVVRENTGFQSLYKCFSKYLFRRSFFSETELKHSNNIKISFFTSVIAI